MLYLYNLFTGRILYETEKPAFAVANYYTIDSGFAVIGKVPIQQWQQIHCKSRGRGHIMIIYDNKPNKAVQIHALLQQLDSLQHGIGLKTLAADLYRKGDGARTD